MHRRFRVALLLATVLSVAAAIPLVARLADQPTRVAATGGAPGQKLMADFAGAWLLDKPPSVFGTTETGMELRADGFWSTFTRSPGGGLVRSSGRAAEGMWEVIDVTPEGGPRSYELIFFVNGGTVGTTPIPGTPASTLHLDNMGVYVADYTRAPAGVIVTDSPDPKTPAIDVTGGWLVSMPPTILGTNELALELRADGRWFELHALDTGGFARLTGPKSSGTWERVALAYSSRPAWAWQVKLQGSGVSLISGEALTPDQERMRMETSGTEPVYYRRANITITG